MYSISEVASQLNIKPHTLRYYEQEGILESSRNQAGVRNYSDQQVQWLRFVLKLRETHMPVATIQQYVKLLQEGEHTVHERLQLLEDHQASIQNQIQELKETEQMLEKKVTTYKDMMNK
ncbi:MULTISPECIES: MerR family transcriptional regulator [Pontibacillus]|uniref:MerR family transcriptional regulator n=1 Tax=Pontibacillus chungwhensis TaxID=265426 RepID=A0ABY8V334_9BACI|nr:MULTISPECIES: MerR family transcriptional regulator [Pontibacillus]MCD5323399.1 MerR family transcriptional regulator [Pontibacillus sp. HN14]WIG00208.1 MerR family transcriptional regulator [Pontibacillus chungwhensis]